jgi:Protein of unknown function (DUF2752)
MEPTAGPAVTGSAVTGPAAVAPSGYPGPRRPVRTTRNAKGTGVRIGALALLAVAAAQVHQHDDPGVICPLRRFTGVPCPFCGSTTMFMEAGAGHWGAALTANPLTVVAVAVFLFSPALAFDAPDRWARLPVRLRWIGGGAVLAASWLWQLHRFGFL